MTGRPNVVLICADQWRGDCLSAAGHPIVRTPYLDALAHSGTRFTRAYSATPTCIPARTALHTGLGQRSHGRVGYLDGVPWHHERTLAGEFSRHGYQTQAIGKMHVHPERHRIGFHNVLLHDGYLHYARGRSRDPRWHDDYLRWLAAHVGESAARDYTEHGLGCNSVVARPSDMPERLHSTNWVVTSAVEFLYRRDPTVPFLLYLSFYAPHPPYTPPQWAFTQYLDTPEPSPPVGDWFDIFTPHRQDWSPEAHCAVYDPATLRRARAGYYGHMSHIDQQINLFLEALGEFGHAQDTIVCFTSDHGEMLGDHHLHRKGYPYEGSARIPLLLAGPGIPAGVVRGEVAELRDVMPTLLDAAGLPVSNGLEGRSLLPLARGEQVAWRQWLHGEHTLFDQSIQWLTDGRHKYVWFSGDGREQLFNLEQDPQECHDLARHPAHADRVAEWRARLVAELRGRPDRHVAGDVLVPGQPAVHVLNGGLAR